MRAVNGGPRYRPESNCHTHQNQDLTPRSIVVDKSGPGQAGALRRRHRTQQPAAPADVRMHCPVDPSAAARLMRRSWQDKIHYGQAVAARS
jgi:hypothetical protein